MVPKYLANCLIVAGLAGCESGHRETTVSGKVMDEQGRVVRQMAVSVFGHKKGTLSSFATLATAHTDSFGQYHMRFTPAKSFNQLLVLPDFGRSYSLASYKDIQFQSPDYCCSVTTGATQVYSFTLISR